MIVLAANLVSFTVSWRSGPALISNMSTKLNYKETLFWHKCAIFIPWHVLVILERIFLRWHFCQEDCNNYSSFSFLIFFICAATQHVIMFLCLFLCLFVPSKLWTWLNESQQIQTKPNKIWPYKINPSHPKPNQIKANQRSPHHLNQNPSKSHAPTLSELFFVCPILSTYKLTSPHTISQNRN